MLGLPPSGWVLLAGIFLLFPLQGYLDRHQGAAPELSEVLPPERLLPALAFGHGETLSDLLEVKATNYLMGSFRSRSRLEKHHLSRLYNAILSLDPNNVDACWRGAVYLA